MLTLQLGNIGKTTLWDFMDINFSAMLMCMPFIMPLIDRAVRSFCRRSEKISSGGTSSLEGPWARPRTIYGRTRKAQNIGNRQIEKIAFHEFILNDTRGAYASSTDDVGLHMEPDS
jgi:hypothetical protein